MSDAAIGSTPAPAKKLGFVGRLDIELESSWRERRWGAFVRAWITTVVVAAAAGFVIPLVMISIYTFVSVVLIRADNKNVPGILNVCSSIAGLTGLLTLIFTVPVMALKSLQGPAK